MYRLDSLDLVWYWDPVGLMSHMHSPSAFPFFLITILLIIYLLKCEARDRINVSDPLSDTGKTLVSAGNRFELGFFPSEGTETSNRYVGIWYYKFKPRTIVWVANRDKPLQCPRGSQNSFRFFGVADDGNIKIWCSKGVPVSVSNLHSSTAFNITLQLLDSGNLILVDGHSGTRLWESFDYPTDTFLPGMKMNDYMKLVSWISPSDLGHGNYTFQRDQEGVYTIQKRSAVYWKSVEHAPFMTIDRLPTIVEQMLSDSDTGLDQKSNKSPVNRMSDTLISYPNYTGAFNYSNSRLVMNSSGEIQYYILVDSGNWSLVWSEPENHCSMYNVCGKFGICNVKNDPICQCPPGFKPVSPDDWENRQYSEGCNRESSICGQKYSFLNISLMKVEGQFTPFDQAPNEEACKEECSNYCNCEAYSYRDVNVSNRETGKSDAKCWIWRTDLVNLHQDYSGGRLNLSLRVPSSVTADSAKRICQPCVTNLIPYPLSTGPHCGDPSYYSFYCNSSTGEISFLTLSEKYQVAGINREERRFVILVDSESADTCNPRNSSSHVLKLNHSLRFTVTNWCYADPSTSSPQIEIGWEPPLEPTCDSLINCKDWPNSDCHDRGNGQKRCYCGQSYQWNDSSATCTEALWKSKNKSQTRYLIAFTVIVAGVMLVSCSGYSLYRRRRIAKRLGNRSSTEASPVLFSYESERQVNDLMHENDRRIDVPFYDLNTILSATENFSDANKLGQGGFGPVYKGKFPGGGEIAVKRLLSCSGQGIEEFLNEVVLIAKLQHRNLVRLLGYCIKENEKILLYEYMPNRSLDAVIFDQHMRLLLDWKKRFDIILGIARGLLYLHQDSRLRIIHRDLKTSNILLDEDMNPKISDFGLARIVKGKGTEGSTNKVVGTYGYMSPEYALDGKFSTKSDVFSFGIVMLEIISGKKNTGFYNPHEVLNLLGYAWRLWCDNKALDLVDPLLLESCEKSQVMKCINIGLLCLQEDPNDRPSMSTVVMMLGMETTHFPLPSQPAFVVRRRPSAKSSSSSAKPDSISNNQLTISDVAGR